MPRKVRDYAKERKYDSKPKVKAARAARGRARYQLEKEGKVSKGDGKHVDHKKPISKGGSNARSNLRVTSAKKNTSYARNANGGMKTVAKKKQKMNGPQKGTIGKKKAKAPAKKGTMRGRIG